MVQSYEEAKNTCYQYEGSSLVTIQSQEEQDFLFNLIHSVHNIVNDVWIGAHYSDKSLNWSDKTDVNFTSWSSGYPSNESGYECVVTRLDEPNHGKWLNEPCEKLYSFVCQNMQNWLFSYLQKTVMDLRDEVKNLTMNLENTIKRLNISESQFHQLNQKVSESTPSGTLAYFANSSAPIGWLIANGQIISRSTYANLFATIGTRFDSGDGSTTFTLPDLRGEFIRGWSDSRDVDRNRVFGSFQWGSSIPYVDQINGKYTIASAVGMSQFKTFANTTFDGGFKSVYPNNSMTSYGMTFPENNVLYYTDINNTGNVTLYNSLQGTRPRNIALLACIKY